jgi:low temperature requirement protein LtrA
MPRYQRRTDAGEQRATTLELFYDLVFVFAVTQVSHLLLDDLSWRGAGRALLALLVVWWAWNYTTWVTNELDPESAVVRLVLLAITLVSLVLAVAIPQAFGSRGLLFAGANVAIQIGRHVFLTFAAAERGTLERRRAAAILTWFAAAAPFWIAGGLVGAPARTWLWLAGLAIDYTAPLLFYRVPGRPRTSERAWQVETSHFAERFQLFVIIALGESIVLTGAATADLELTPGRWLAFALAFASTAAFWWLYFTYVARIAQRRLELAPNRTRLARDGYTYLHAVIVAAVIAGAVGDELVIAHPGARPGTAEAVAVAAGPALYLLGHALFRLRMAGSISVKRLTGALACAVLGAAGTHLPALALQGLLVAVLAGVIAAEELAARRRAARGEPAPLERLETSTG